MDAPGTPRLFGTTLRFLQLLGVERLEDPPASERRTGAEDGEAPVRLNRFLAMAGVAARRKADDLIAAGRVTVNGEAVPPGGVMVQPDSGPGKR